MSFVIPAADPAPVPAVRTDEAKAALLRTKVGTLLQSVPAGTTPEMIDIFALSVAVRAALPQGLKAHDFDGNDVQAIVSDLLGV